MAAIVLSSLLILSMVTGIIAMHFSKNDTQNHLIPEKVDINGSNQWISLSDTLSPALKPVILFLHGGPGSANLSILNQLCPELEKQAVIINWDQRAAGKSFSIWRYFETLSLEQNIIDAHSLTQYIKNKYKVQKITLMGFSAGTALGMLLIKRYPEEQSVYWHLTSG